jgi:isochorismate synthase EntC
MGNALNDQDKESFLNTGGIFGYGNEIWLFWGSVTCTKERPQKPSLLRTHYFLDEEWSWLSYSNYQKFDRQELLQVFKNEKLKLNWLETSKNKFSQQFEFVHNWIENKEILKAVPYVFTQCHQSLTKSELEFLVSAAIGKLQGYIYGSWDNNQGILGLTPEILVSQEFNQFSSMALAGTCLLSDYENDPKEFLKSEKDQLEHQFVVDDLQKLLGGFANFKKSPMGIEKTPRLAHLKTQMSWTLEPQKSLEDMIKLLHPTPALGCYPRENGFSYMKKLNEISPRGRFGAPFGFSQSKDQAQVVVAIRNISWDHKALQMGTGCGVVKESLFEAEWNEILNKKQSIKEIFNLL